MIKAFFFSYILLFVIAHQEMATLGTQDTERR